MTKNCLLSNSIDAIENDICVGNNSSVDVNQKIKSITFNVAKISVQSSIPHKQQQPTVLDEVITTSTSPFQINRYQVVGSSKIPLPSKSSIIASPVIIQEIIVRHFKSFIFLWVNL